jgi:acetyl-CoA carboxylase biotin carboxyl carrier protein
MTLRYEEIAEILRIIDSSSCDEVVIETEEVKLVVRRNSTAGPADLALPERPTAPLAAATDSLSQLEPAAPPSAGAKIAVTGGQFVVTAPMVGTFYRQPSPDAPPFVEIDSVVRKGQPLCLIEVMKLFTTIHAEQDGRIVQIGANNGELVEYGQTLFVIEPLA